MSTFVRIEDKFVPLYRIMWVAATPHFCGEEDCLKEGHYEVMLEQSESIWAHTKGERDEVIDAIDQWQQGYGPSDELPDDDSQ